MNLTDKVSMQWRQWKVANKTSNQTSEKKCRCNLRGKINISSLGFRIKLSAFQNKRINTVSYLSDSVSVKLLIKEKEEEEGILVWRGEGD